MTEPSLTSYHYPTASRSISVIALAYAVFAICASVIKQTPYGMRAFVYVSIPVIVGVTFGISLVGYGYGKFICRRSSSLKQMIYFE